MHHNTCLTGMPWLLLPLLDHYSMLLGLQLLTGSSDCSDSNLFWGASQDLFQTYICQPVSQPPQQNGLASLRLLF